MRVSRETPPTRITALESAATDRGGGVPAYSCENVDVSYVEQHPVFKEFGGTKTRGLSRVFDVIDHNFQSKNRWTFEVFVPSRWMRGDHISVQPIRVPNRKAWSELERRSLQFGKCTLGRWRKLSYGKLAMASNEKNREYLREGEKPPRWLKDFAIKPKRRVATTRGYDGHDLVALVDPQDHAAMIRLFLALKPWVLDAGYSRASARSAQMRARRRLLRGYRLRDKVVCVTGRLGMGTRGEVTTRLKRLGATVRQAVSAECDFLVEGYHPLGDKRVKVRSADKLGIPRMSEATFRARFFG